MNLTEGSGSTNVTPIIKRSSPFSLSRTGTLFFPYVMHFSVNFYFYVLRFGGLPCLCDYFGEYICTSIYYSILGFYISLLSVKIYVCVCVLNLILIDNLFLEQM